MTAVSRERAYLDALRGPAGQTVRYRRVGQVAGDTVKDEYEITYDGQAQPVHVFLDAYHWADPAAPRGFTCRQPFQLQPPAPDAAGTAAALRALAVRYGATRDIDPISLDANGSGTHGVAFDSFRIVARAAREAAKRGQPLDPRALSDALVTAPLVIVAHALQCGGAPVAPTMVELLDGNDQLAPRDTTVTDRAKADALLPGAIPATSLAAAFGPTTFHSGDAVRITYAGAACPGSARTVVLPIRLILPHATKSAPAQLPAGVAAADVESGVRLQVLIDPDGVPQDPEYVAGPYVLMRAAAAAALEWRWEPARANGAPLAAAFTIGMPFKTQ